MKVLKCAICESPTATSVHFGARACKACAAFFRRTVALNVAYECKEPKPCTIHYEKRMSCKKCRYDKCIAAKMRRELVKSTRGSINSSHSSLSLYKKSASKYHSICHRGSNSRTFNARKVTFAISKNPAATTEEDELDKEALDRVMSHYRRIESDLNKRRRILYTDTKMHDTFAGICECVSVSSVITNFHTKRSHPAVTF
ncbi:zinc finger, C4 type [Oesophagostomum dentatum]|uniref:Zinc finger, C4 type n=1 Tax=Oesophagostomum dentatum TaxID=61180 RepID=A0A0B1SP05_OESDE|nr:zinc finger, C4 type [Oesophagostomum dentatum]